MIKLTGVPFVVGLVQWILWHALEEELKDGGGILLPIMPQDVHW